MPIRCIAIDDEPLALALIKEYIGQCRQLQLIESFEDAIAGAEYLGNHPVDLLFIDINMPDITGLDLVRSLTRKPMIIFTTAYNNYAIDGFELDAVDYLLKPISFERFSRAVAKATDYFAYKNKQDQPNEECLFVYSEYRMLKILLSEIDYIESLEDYIKIHLQQGKPVLTLMTLKGVLEKLPASRFSRIHRSYIVANGRVKSIHNRKVKLASGIELPVSETYTSFIVNWKKG